MTQVILPGDLETTMAIAAQRAGTTTALLAIESLRQMYPPEPIAPEPGGSLLDFLGDLVGCVDGPVGNFSENTGKQFADLLEEKHDKQ